MPIRLTRTVKIMAIFCIAVFILQQISDRFLGFNMEVWFGLVPFEFIVHHRFWQLFTYIFLHGDVMHLFLNLLVLAFVGSDIEALWGRGRFLRYFFFCSTFSGAVYLLMQLFVLGEEGLHVPMIGASGGIYGLLTAYGLIFGDRVMLFMMIFPMKAKHFVWVLAAVEFLTVFSKGALASVAHLGGMLGGFIYLMAQASILLAKKRRAEAASGIRRRGQKKRKKVSQHLKLVIDNDREEGSDQEIDDKPTTWH